MEKANGIQTIARYGSTEHALTLIQHVYFFKTSYLSKKYTTSVLLLFKGKLLWKLLFGDESLTKLTSVWKYSCGMVLASPGVGQTCGLLWDFKACGLQKFIFY